MDQNQNYNPAPPVQPQVPQPPMVQPQPVPLAQPEFATPAPVAFAAQPPIAPIPGAVPAFQPAQPMQPIQPFQPAQPMQQFNQPVYAVPVSQGKPKVGLIIGIIAGAVLLIAAAAAAIFLFGAPTKDDYKKAQAATAESVSAYNDMQSVYIGSSSTETEIKNGFNQLKDNRDKFNTRFAELKTLKAISNDSEMNKLYQAAVSKKAKFDEASDLVLEAYEKIMPAVSSMQTSITSTSSSGDVLSAIKSVRSSLEALTLVAQVNKDYVSSLVRDLKKMEDLIPRVVAGKADYRKYDSAAVNDYYDTADSLSKAGRDWQSNAETATKNGEMKDELNKLEEALFTKSIKA